MKNEIVKVLERRKPTPQPLEQVRAGIVAAMAKERGTAAALKAVESARTQLESGKAFDAVAHELSVTADPAHFVGRRDPSIPAQVRDAVFASPLPSGKPIVRALALNDGGAAVLVVSAVRTPAARDALAQRDRVQQQAQRMGEDEAQAYVEEVRRTADVRKNPKAFE